MDYKLIPPSLEYKDEYMAMIAEYPSDNDATPVLRENREYILKHPDEYIQKLLDYEKGINLPEGDVPCSTYWLWNGGRILGESRIRHSLSTEKLATIIGHVGYDIRPSERGKGLGTALLKLTLEKCRELGIDKILVVCDMRNSSSIKLIEKNGGVLDADRPAMPNEIGHVARYWITV